MAMKSEEYHAMRPVGLLVMSIPFFLTADLRAGEKGAGPLEWTIAASKAAYYPGEPVALTITIQNLGPRDDAVFMAGLCVGIFSFDLRDSSGRTISQGGPVSEEAHAPSRRPAFLKVPAGQTATTRVVLNRWCSTMVPPGEYRVICRADYTLKSEATPVPGTTKSFRLEVHHRAEMSLDVNVVKADPPKYKEILDDLEKEAIKERQRGETFESQNFAAEMIAFCEWPEAVPYQLRAVKNVGNDPWLTLHLVRHLGKSKSLEVAKGLISLADDPAPLIQSYRSDVIKAVHALHASGQADIVKATEAFVKEHPLAGPPTEGSR